MTEYETKMFFSQRLKIRSRRISLTSLMRRTNLRQQRMQRMQWHAMACNGMQDGMSVGTVGQDARWDGRQVRQDEHRGGFGRGWAAPEGGDPSHVTRVAAHSPQRRDR